MSEALLPEEDPSLLEDLNDLAGPEDATKGQRFINYLADQVLLYFANNALAGILAVPIVQQIAVSASGTAFGAGGSLFKVMIYLIVFTEFYALTILYYTLTEGILQGRTLGKLLTGTHAVGLDGYKPVTGKQALYRSLCRVIPFEAFAAIFGTPWHDRFTHTTVVKK